MQRLYPAGESSMPIQRSLQKPATRRWPRVLALLLGGIPVMASIPDSPASAGSATKAGQSSANDDATLTALSTFMREYDHALVADDHSYLSAHTVFPLPFADTEYNMEVKKKVRKVPSADELLKLKDTLRVPEAILPDGPQTLSHVHRGEQKCSDPKSPDVPDWSKGPLALTAHKEEAKFTYLSLPCDSEVHLVTLTFKYIGGVWKLTDRAVHMGAG
jgi:hypothetical protein